MRSTLWRKMRVEECWEETAETEVVKEAVKDVNHWWSLCGCPGRPTHMMCPSTQKSFSHVWMLWFRMGGYAEVETRRPQWDEGVHELGFYSEVEKQLLSSKKMLHIWILNNLKEPFKGLNANIKPSCWHTLLFQGGYLYISDQMPGGRTVLQTQKTANDVFPDDASELKMV